MKKAEDALPNELLSYEREHRQLTQEEVAEQIGVPDYNMIGRWERGITLPSAHHRQQLTTLFGKSARELGFVRKGEIPFWRVPYRQNVFFTGRSALLAQVHTSLVAHRHARLVPPQTFSGLGGVGKTQVALEYAYRYGHEYHTVIWMRASSRETLTSDYAAITELLNLPEQHEQDQRQMIRAVKAWLAAMTRWLLIFDNVEDLDLLDDFLPSPVRGHILLTTRMQITGTMAETLEIETMDLEEGSYFLLRRAKLLALNASLDDIAEAERNQARAIVERVGGLPLALDQAGAYIEETGCTLANYSERYHAHQAELLRWRGVMGTGHPESVVTTLSLSFEQVSHANPVARDMLSFCALLAPDTIPEELLMEGLQELASPLLAHSADPLQFDQVMKDLRKFSLVRRRPETNMLTIHRLVQAVLLDEMEQETQSLWAERIVRTLSRIFPHKSIDAWQQCERLLAQANSCAELIEERNITTPEA
ncbi:MAG TPA: NB-ARC domain-containing protein, partial [Ktedonobacteraceae bacterium]|nr:NB-ARC domain-containing protein [Ktedonobacteraceae bacterium]